MAPLPGMPGADGEDAKMSKAKIINETTWCLYCCCQGWGCGRFSDPLIAAEIKQCCCRESVSTTDCSGKDGLCNQISVVCCITSQCQMPPAKTAPKFACCNKKCCGSCGSTESFEDGLFDTQKILDETFWLNYCLCSGCGFNGMSQGLFSQQFKELCCRGYTNIEPASVDGVFCSSVQKQCCIMGECQMPPYKPNPTIACCTWRMNKEKAEEAPSQKDMPAGGSGGGPSERE